MPPPTNKKAMFSSPVWGEPIRFRKGHHLYAQGDRADHLFYVREGRVKVITASRTGKEAILGILGPGDILGAMALSGDPFRAATATAVTDCIVYRMNRKAVENALGGEVDFARQFVLLLLERNRRLLATVLDRTFHSAEKRLARALLEMAVAEEPNGSKRTIPPISQAVLAKIVGTTRPRINLFMTRFRKLGYIKYNGGIEVSDSLAKVLL